MKKILISLFFLILFFPKQISAQAFTCTYAGPDSQRCVVDVSNGTPCDGSVKDSDQAFCGGFTTDEACENAVGLCSSCNSPSVCQVASCNEGYVNASGTCSTSGEICCISEDEEEPPPEYCWRCVTESFSGHYCAAFSPEGEDCGDYWRDTDRAGCAVDCEEADSFQNFSCDDSYQCVVAANGKFTGGGAYVDCLNACKRGFPFCYVGDNKGIPTAIGCFVFDPLNQSVVNVFSKGISVAGAIVLLVISYASLLYMTSQGNPQKLGESRSIVIAAITGLLLVVLGIMLYRVIASDLLGLF